MTMIGLWENCIISDHSLGRVLGVLFLDRSDRLDLELSFAVTGASFLGAVKRLWRLVLLRGLGEGVYSFTHLNVFAASRVYLPILIINRRTCAWMWRGH